MQRALQGACLRSRKRERVLACSTSVGLSDRWMAMACGLGCAIFGTSHSVASDCRCHLKSEVLFLFFSPFPLSF